MHSQVLRRSLKSGTSSLVVSTRARPRPTTKSVVSPLASAANTLAKRLQAASTDHRPDDGRITTAIPPRGPPTNDPENDDEPTEQPEKTKTKKTKAVVVEPLVLPDEAQKILWEKTSRPVDSEHLPPPPILEEALTNLRITFLKTTQHKGTVPSFSGHLTEPTIALYCPIEGGEYLIDATLRELSRQTGAEVVEIDAAQLAAGIYGIFGSAASAVKMPRNPLHFSTLPGSKEEPEERERDEEEDEPTPKVMTFILAPPSGRDRITISTKRDSSPNLTRRFFDAVVNIPSLPDTPPDAPRIVYIRDSSLIASSSHIWYPHLVAAVRERRMGKSSSAIKPTTIVFGATPLLSSHAESSDSKKPNPKIEQRLQTRLKLWASGGDQALSSELPHITTDPGGEESEEPNQVFVTSFSSYLSGPKRDSQGLSPPKSQFFRTTVLVPKNRSLEVEMKTRADRRRVLNELAIRMAVGEVGGEIEKGSLRSSEYDDTGIENSEVDSPIEPENPIQEIVPESAVVNIVDASELDAVDENASTAAPSTQPPPSTETPPRPSLSEAERLWNDAGLVLASWASLKTIADKTVGLALENETVQNAPIPWSAVHHAWAVHNDAQDDRKKWAQSLATGTETLVDSATEQPVVDEVIEGLKEDNSLSAHEQRLLPCIVDTGHLTTSFDQVHLPHDTLDSVRTIVSLPLLFPDAFQEGILKTHGLTGCLLFGPPGTGKTLVVKALAKEAGCRMISVMPSDLMDLYVGEGEKLVKALFSLAKKLNPVVIFIDEIDALLGARMGRDSGGGGAFAHRGVITEFMQNMDGLKTSLKDRIVVVGATNRPFDLDDAVLRRLPRRLLVDLPGEPERLAILKILLRDETLADDVQIEALAKQTSLYSGSDLKNLCVSAALDAVKEMVTVPWAKKKEPAPIEEQGSVNIPETDPSSLPRVLKARNFAKGLKEITPSSSESLGSLVDLRKWNEEFGDGHKTKKTPIWGKGKFGFINPLTQSNSGQEGKVSVADDLK